MSSETKSQMIQVIRNCEGRGNVRIKVCNYCAKGFHRKDQGYTSIDTNFSHLEGMWFCSFQCMHAMKYGNSCYMKQIAVGQTKKGVKLFKPVWLLRQGSLRKWISRIDVKKGETITVTGDNADSDEELAAVDDQEPAEVDEEPFPELGYSKSSFSWADET